MKPDLAILASGSGSNFDALAEAFPGRVGLLISNVSEAGVLKRSERRSVPSQVLEHGDYETRQLHERAITESLQQRFSANALRALLLAGYMRVLSPSFFHMMAQLFPHCEIINLHPADPKIYRGARAYHYAVANRFNRWQLCVHKVTEELDGGPILAMSEHVVYPWESEQQLNERLRKAEHELFISVVRSMK